MVDAELITRKMLLITRDLRELESLARMTKEQFLSGRTEEIVAERYR